MGQHAYATLSYGVIVDDDAEYSENVRAFPWPNPKYDSEGYDEWVEDYDTDLIAVVCKVDGIARPGWGTDEREAIERAIPIEIVSAGVEDYHTEIMAIKGTITRSPEYGAAKVDSQIRPGEALELRVQRAKSFCEKYGLCPFDSPSWIVSASFG